MPKPSKKSFDERRITDRHKDRSTPIIPDVTHVSSLPIPTSIDTQDKQDLWAYITKDLASRKILSETYLLSIEMLVDNVIRLKEYRTQLDDLGPMIPVFDKDGERILNYKANPMFDMVMTLENRITKLCEKFGLTPRDVIYLKNPDVTTKVIETTTEDSKKKDEYFR